LGIDQTEPVRSAQVGKYKAGESEDFSGERVTRSVHESLERLGLKYIDLIICHDIESAVDMKQASCRLCAARLAPLAHSSFCQLLTHLACATSNGCCADRHGHASCAPEAEGAGRHPRHRHLRTAAGHLFLRAGQVVL